MKGIQGGRRNRMKEQDKVSEDRTRRRETRLS